MDNTRKRKKNKKAYYVNNKKVKTNLRLGEGMKGFMLTCNNKEKQCIAEAYNLLNEFAEGLCEPEFKEDPSEIKESSESEGDVSKELEKELQEIKAVKPTERRFQAVNTSANNCLFIKTQVSNPVELVRAMLLEIEKTEKKRTRYLLRMIPVLHTCKAHVDVITKHASVLLDSHNDEIAKYKSFAVNFKARNNASVGRADVINTLAGLIHAKNPAIKADLKNPDVVVSVDIIGPICCFSVLPDYYRFKKYNLAEVASGNAAKRQKEETESGLNTVAAEVDQGKAEPPGNGELTPVKAVVPTGNTDMNVADNDNPQLPPTGNIATNFTDNDNLKLSPTGNTNTNITDTPNIDDSKNTGGSEQIDVLDDAKLEK